MSVRSSLEKLKRNLRSDGTEAALTANLFTDLSKVSESCYDFGKFPEYQEYSRMQWFLEKESLPDTTFRRRAAVSDATVELEGRQLVNYSTYNYLGLAGHPEVVQAAQDAVQRFGTSTGSGRSITGEIDLHQQFEKEICQVLGTEDAVLSVGGYSTNAFTVGYLSRGQDLIIHDELIHNSALTGCMMSQARRMSFPHNDFDALELLLKKYRLKYQRVLILLEGVYSMDGDIPDIPKAIEIKNRYKALLMVDEAHSMGVIGNKGLGVVDHFGIDGKDIDIHFGSLSKAFGTCGGYVAGRKPLISILKHYAPGVLLYGAAPTPANTAAGLQSLRIMKREPELAKALRENSAYFIEKAKQKNLDTGPSQGSGVVPVMIPDSEQALWVSLKMFEEGFCAYPMLYPIVPRNRSRIRFFINANHTKEQLNSTIECLDRLIQSAPKPRGIF